MAPKIKIEKDYRTWQFCNLSQYVIFLSWQYLHKSLVKIKNLAIFLSTEQKAADDIARFVPALDVVQMYL